MHPFKIVQLSALSRLLYPNDQHTWIHTFFKVLRNLGLCLRYASLRCIASNQHCSAFSAFSFLTTWYTFKIFFFESELFPPVLHQCIMLIPECYPAVLIYELVLPTRVHELLGGSCSSFSSRVQLLCLVILLLQ